MNFHPWCVSLGKSLVTTTGAGGLESLFSMSSNRRMRSTADTYSAPPANATPAGSCSPEAIVNTCAAAPGANRIAYTLPARIEPTNNVPLSPNAMPRAFSTRATTSIAKPLGSLMFSSGSDCDCASANAANAHARTLIKRRSIEILLVAPNSHARVDSQGTLSLRIAGIDIDQRGSYAVPLTFDETAT